MEHCIGTSTASSSARLKVSFQQHKCGKAQDVTLEELREWLEKSPTEPDTVSQSDFTVHKPSIIKVSLAPVDSRFAQAVVTTDRDLLQDGQSQDMQGPRGCELTIDDHFEGMTVLSTDDTADSPDSIAAE
ncbi:MAG: hypothetical protein M1819_005557 [Sarea resinae]|nr:MAG: hypothetical protein M1819_005557 [Sarea resinae]